MDPFSAIAMVILFFFIFKLWPKKGQGQATADRSAGDAALNKLWDIAFDPSAPTLETVSTIDDYAPQIDEVPLETLPLTDVPIDPYANLPAVNLPRVG